MVVLVLERVPASLRGLLTRWMLEVRTGVYVGSLSALVRDKLWLEACRAARDGACLLIHNTNNEQGFAVRSHGVADREVIVVEGLTLVRVKKRPGQRRTRAASEE
ncbi:MAG TPA: type I-E CRISPR-associated endoribonuclease Cas2e [Chloroflexota bacterium]